MKSCAQRGFTVTELLVTVAIIGVLGSLMLPARQTMQRNSDRTATMASLQSVGRAIQLYMTDNDGYLPGPLTKGQDARYNRGGNRTLGYHLWAYLGAPEPTSELIVAKAIQNPAHLRYRQGGDSSKIYVMNDLAEDFPGVRSVWGLRNANGTIVPSVKHVRLQDPSKKWAIQDIDQEHPEVQGAGWFSDLSPKPVLDDVRMSLFFDWHVEPVSVNGATL